MNDHGYLELTRGCADVIVEAEFKERLTQGRPLRVKLGMDPTASDIHLGHTVLLNKLRQFQEHGHQVLFIIGDFTAMIGDPTGKNITRQPLTMEQITAHAQTYQEQVFKILDPEKTQVHYNSKWLGQHSAADLIRLAASQTVARMLERDDFSKRYKQGVPIAIHEFLYPLLQGYDSVALEADVELGGTDQTFNLLMGRELQRNHQQKPQSVITMPLLEGLDGVKKMSKSLKNYIGITQVPDQMYGQLMSISDTLMWRYFELLSARSLAELQRLKASVSEGANPRDIKYLLAEELVARYHGKKSAQDAQQQFVERFRQGKLPADLPEQTVTTSDATLGIAYLLKQADLVVSTSEALRMIRAKAVRIDGEQISDTHLLVPAGACHVFQVGKKRIAKLRVVHQG